MDFLLIVLSLLALVGGFFFLSEATMGVGIIAIGGVLAIYSRLAQANTHHVEIKRLLGEVPPEKPPKALGTADLARMLEEIKKAKQSDS